MRINYIQIDCLLILGFEWYNIIIIINLVITNNNFKVKVFIIYSSMANKIM